MDKRTEVMASAVTEALSHKAGEPQGKGTGIGDTARIAVFHASASKIGAQHER